MSPIKVIQVKIAQYNKIFTCGDLDYVHAPKIGSRSILGWFAIIKKPDLYKSNPEFFEEIKPKVEGAYGEIRAVVANDVHLESVSPNRFCVRRDPVKRFISGFKNRVHTHDECDVKDWDEFVDRFEEIYRDNSAIWVHFRPQTLFYGDNQNIYTRIFRTENLDACRLWLSDRFNQELPQLRLNQNIPVDVDPTEKQIQKIKQFYSVDYHNGWC